MRMRNRPCYPETSTMPLLTRNSAFTRVTKLAGQRPVHSAFSWLHGNPKRIMDWQAEMVAIPAPPFGERARSEWMMERFEEAGLCQIHTDAVGNVVGFLPAANLSPESTGPIVVISAHIDTVFPLETPLNLVLDGDRLEGPGACDNGAGVAPPGRQVAQDDASAMVLRRQRSGQCQTVAAGLRRLGLEPVRHTSGKG